MGVGAPYQCPLGKIAMLPSLYADVRTILMVLLAFKGRNPVQQKRFFRRTEGRRAFLLERCNVSKLLEYECGAQTTDGYRIWGQ